jgi:hypothetical protein
LLSRAKVDGRFSAWGNSSPIGLFARRRQANRQRLKTESNACSPPDAGGCMLTAEQLTCPKCQGQLAAVFAGKRPRRRQLVCPNCDKAPDPLSTPEVQGGLKAAGIGAMLSNNPNARASLLDGSKQRTGTGNPAQENRADPTAVGCHH